MRRITRNTLALMLAVGLIAGLGGCTISSGYRGYYGSGYSSYDYDCSPLIWSWSFGNRGWCHSGSRHSGHRGGRGHHGGGHHRGR